MKKLLATMLALTMLCTMLAGCQDKKSSKKDRDKHEDKESVSYSDVVNDSDEDEKDKSKKDDKNSPEEDDEKISVSSENFTPGYRTQKEYKNKSLGLKITLNSRMVMATDEEISNMMQVGADIIKDTELGKQIKDISKIDAVYDMIAVNTINNSNVMVMAEKLPLSAITMPQYIDNLKQQLESVGMTSNYRDVYEQELCGISFSNLTYTMNYSGVELTQTMLLKKVGDRMVAITFSYSEPEMLEDWLKCFSKI